MTSVIEGQEEPRRANHRAAAIVQCATFRVERLLCGIDVQHVQEVLNSQETTRVPHAPAIVVGLINLRGQIVTALDVRKRMGLPERDDAVHPMNVVIRTNEGPLSLLVDEIGEVIEVHPDQYEEAPAGLDSAQRELLQGIYKLEGQLLLMLEPERVAEIGLQGIAAGETK